MKKKRSTRKEAPPPADWRCRLPRLPKLTQKQSGIGAAVMSFIAALAALPYTLGEISLVIPAEWKPTVTATSLAAAFILRVINQTTPTP